MKQYMDVAVMERRSIDPTSFEAIDYQFVRNVKNKTVGDTVTVTYTRDNETRHFDMSLVKDDGVRFIGIAVGDKVVLVRPPIPDDAIRMSHAGVAQPIEVVNEHIAKLGGVLATALEAVVDGAAQVLAVVLQTGLGVYFRENGIWQMKRVDPRLTEGTQLQPLAPDALEYWDDWDQSDGPMTIYDLPYIVDGERVDPSMREDADGPAEDEEAFANPTEEVR